MRTTHRSKAKTKLYAVRQKGKFKDIQTYRKAHKADISKTSLDEEVKLLRKLVWLVLIDYYDIRPDLTKLYLELYPYYEYALAWEKRFGKKVNK